MRSSLFIITALAIGSQAFVHMIMFVCGNSFVDFRPFTLLPLAGAALLIFSALVPIRFRWIRWVALLACAIPWFYFGSGIFFYFRAIARGEDYFDILILISSLLLLASSIYAVLSLRKHPAT